MEIKVHKMFEGATISTDPGQGEKRFSRIVTSGMNGVEVDVYAQFSVDLGIATVDLAKNSHEGSAFLDLHALIIFMNENGFRLISHSVASLPYPSGIMYWKASAIFRRNT